MENLQEHEIVVSAQRVKYSHIYYDDKYVIIEQNRTRRRVPLGYYFEDSGCEIYISIFFSGIFQHQQKIRRFIVNTETKKWRDFISVTITKCIPDKKVKLENNIINNLKK